MTSQKADLFLHPIRLRIITTLSTHRMAVKDIARAISDVPLTTLYRNINALLEGGIIQVVEENQIRGTVERVYALSGIPTLTAEDLEGMTKADYEQAFTIFLSTLMGDARRYLESKSDSQEIHLIEDGVVVSKIDLYLSPDENRSLNQRIQDIFLEAGINEPTPARQRYTLAYVVIPQ